MREFRAPGSVRELSGNWQFYLNAALMSHPLYQLLRSLEDAKIRYTLSRNRDDTVLVCLTLVGERVEVDVFEDGHMEVSRFPGSEAVVGREDLLERLIDENRN